MKIKVGAVVLAILLVAVPVIASSINIAANTDKIKQGQWVNFFTHVDIDTNNQFYVDRMTFIIKNAFDAEVENCKFDTEGNFLEGCDKIKTIIPIKGKENDELGYHYGSKQMWFKVVVETETLLPGSYYAQQFAVVVDSSNNEEEFSSDIAEFSVVEWKRQGPKKVK